MTGQRRSAHRAYRGPDEPTPGSAADLTPAADPESVARTIVLTALTAAPRSRAQLQARLEAKGAPADVAARVLDRFEQVGLVDDAEYARLLVRSKRASRGLAGRALRQELRRTGVDDETAAAALAELDPDDELRAARALVARKLPASRGLPVATRLSRLGGMLARKGYSSGVAYRVVREALAAEGVDPVGGDAIDGEGDLIGEGADGGPGDDGAFG